MRMGRHVDRHVVDFGRQIRAVVQVEGAQKVLIGLSLPGMLRDDESRDVLEDRARAQQRLACELGLTDVAGGCGLHVADPRGDDRDGRKRGRAGAAGIRSGVRARPLDGRQQGERRAQRVTDGPARAAPLARTRNPQDS